MEQNRKLNKNATYDKLTRPDGRIKRTIVWKRRENNRREKNRRQGKVIMSVIVVEKSCEDERKKGKKGSDHVETRQDILF